MKDIWVLRRVNNRRVSLFTTIAKAIQYTKVEYGIELKTNNYRGPGNNDYVSDHVGIREGKVAVLCDRMIVR